MTPMRSASSNAVFVQITVRGDGHRQRRIVHQNGLRETEADARATG